LYKTNINVITFASYVQTNLFNITNIAGSWCYQRHHH